MDKRERVIRTLEHEEADKVPIYYLGMERSGTTYQIFRKSPEYKANKKRVFLAHDITVQRFFNVDACHWDPFPKLKLSTFRTYIKAPKEFPNYRLDYFGRLFKLGKNQQKEFFRLLQDLSASSMQPVAAILSSEPIKAILSDDRLTSGQKAKRIKENLLKLRYPRFSKTEDAFCELRRELRLPPSINLHPPPFFEGNNYRIDFSFKNASDFEKILKILNSIAAEHKLEKLDRLVE